MLNARERKNGGGILFEVCEKGIEGGVDAYD